MERSRSSWRLGLDWILPSKQPDYQNILTGQKAPEPARGLGCAQEVLRHDSDNQQGRI